MTVWHWKINPLSYSRHPNELKNQSTLTYIISKRLKLMSQTQVSCVHAKLASLI